MAFPDDLNFAPVTILSPILDTWRVLFPEKPKVVVGGGSTPVDVPPQGNIVQRMFSKLPQTVGEAGGSLISGITKPLLPTLLIILAGGVVFFLILGKLQRA